MYKSILSLLAIFQIMEKVQMLIKLHPSIEENLGKKIKGERFPGIIIGTIKIVNTITQIS